MGYTKMIVAGETLELYEYEKNISPFAGKRVRAQKGNGLSSVASDRGTLQPTEPKGKRPDSARRASVAFRRLVASNLGRDDRPLLFTLTWAENLTDLRRAYAHFTAFIQALRYKYGRSFRYVAVPEFQKRGAVHFHALVWGLPSEVLLRERTDRTIANLWSVGFVYIKETDGNERLSSYLSKYMAKAFLDPRLKGLKAYVGSRNLKRPRIESGFSPVHYVLDDWVGVDNLPLKDKTFMSQWLGKGRYRLYKINP